jgi:hypothetical protein
MLCGFTSGVGLRVLKLPLAERSKIFGTWDFKWPRGSKLRVAFQELPRADIEAAGQSFDELVRKVKVSASRWVDAYREAYRSSQPPLELVFLDERLPPPAGREEAGKSAPQPKAVEYDVLVSLASLPFHAPYTVKRATTAVEKAAARPGADGKTRVPLWRSKAVTRANRESKDPLVVALPTAQLGRYALRCDYGVPTVYLGRPERTAVVTQEQRDGVGALADRAGELLPPKDQKLVDYFGPSGKDSTSKEFEATVVHEFGHILGIPHLHQSPLTRLRWRSIEELRTLIALATGVDADESFIRGQLLLPFPSTQSSRGQVLFSDWTPVEVDRYGDPNLAESAMTHPLLPLMLVPAAASAPAVAIKRAVAPGAIDLEFLRGMYEAAS